MEPSPNCPRCGAPRLANAPAGLCPRCLLQQGLAHVPEAEPENESPEAVAFSFDVRKRQRTSGVLAGLAETFGPPPRMLLRDVEADRDGPALPSSEKLPTEAGDAGRYQLLGEIARGGMGVVLKGRDVDLGRDVAVKVLLEKHCDRSEMLRRFVEEAQIAGQLQHPGIIPIYELGRLPDDRLYIAMKLIRGRTLASLLEGRADPADERLRYLGIFEQVCQAMAYAHACGVVHRDLKPSNVMVGNFGEVLVMDWGLAKVIALGGVADEERSQRGQAERDAVHTLRTGSAADESHVGSVFGTPSYMPPEQALGKLDTLDERADVFGLGAILCEILTGLPPYSAPSGDEIYQQAARADLSPTLARLDECAADAELIALAKACLAAAPRDRPRHAGVVVASLTAYLAGVQERLKAAELARSRAELRAAEERKRRVLLASLAASLLALAVLGGGGGWWLAQQRTARQEAAGREARTTLHEASLSLGRARAAADDDQAPWAEASQAAKRAAGLLNRPELSPELQREIADFADMVDREHRQAELRSKDSRMLERLAAIHSEIDADLDYVRADREHATAFRNYGIDVELLPTPEAASLVAAAPIAAELVDSLDQWSFIRKTSKQPGAEQLSAIAKAADSNPWRCRVRDVLDRQGEDPAAIRQELEDLAATVPTDALPREIVSRLAYALGYFGDKEKSAELLRSAQNAHPEDFWINHDLARSLMGAGQPAEAARFYTAAVAIRPQSERVRKSLREALRAAGVAE